MRFQAFASYFAALVLASLVPACAEAIFDGTIKIMPSAFIVALGHAIVLGLPVFLFLRSRRRANGIMAAAGGFMVATLPFAFIHLLMGGAGNVTASTNGVPTIVQGVRTLAGWLEFGELALILGALGALAGETFWVVLRISGGIDTGTADHATAPGQAQRRRSMVSTTALAGLAVLLSGSVLAIPSITKDRTCHNLLRDRSFIVPQVVMRLQVEPADWPELMHLFRDFGAVHALSFRDQSHEQPGTVQVLGLSLCNEAGIAVTSHEQRWASQKIRTLGVNGGVFVGVYETREHSGWQAPAREIIDQMEAAWPGKLSFQDGGGHTIPKPEQLRNVSAPNP
jgi:hypothetical protein